MTNDIRLQVEYLTTELLGLLMEKYNWEPQRALDELYSSETYRRLCKPDAGLYYESPLYVFSYLQNEFENGKVA